VPVESHEVTLHAQCPASPHPPYQLSPIRSHYLLSARPVLTLRAKKAPRGHTTCSVPDPSSSSVSQRGHTTCSLPDLSSSSVTSKPHKAMLLVLCSLSLSFPYPLSPFKSHMRSPYLLCPTSPRPLCPASPMMYSPTCSVPGLSSSSVPSESHEVALPALCPTSPHPTRPASPMRSPYLLCVRPLLILRAQRVP
jgi:hypothetical protein